MAKKNKTKEIEVVLSVFSNTLLDEAAYQLLQMFYKGAVENSIGMMRALNNNTGEEELLLVGIERAEGGGVNTYPLARVLNPQDVPVYFSPDGNGGWFDPAEPNVAESEPMDFSIPEENEPTIN